MNKELVPTIKVHFQHVEVQSVLNVVECPFESVEIYSNEDIATIAHYYIGDEANEVMLSIMVNEQNQLIGTHRFSIGGISSVLLPSAECFKSALVNKAHAIFLAHVHPSGKVRPSTFDVEATKRIMATGKLIGIPVLGHVIVTYEKGNYHAIDISNDRLHGEW